MDTKLNDNWKGYNKLDTKLREIVERFIMARRKFDKQFKNSAVKLILEEGYSVKEVSQELEVHAQFEIKKLEKENKLLLEELALLKKFQVFLKPSRK